VPTSRPCRRAHLTHLRRVDEIMKEIIGRSLGLGDSPVTPTLAAAPP
jgi:hypothetical protein